MIGNLIPRRRRWLIALVLVGTAALAIASEAGADRPVVAAGTARVTTPEVDVTRPMARSVNLDELVESALQADASLRVFRIGDARIQVFAGGPGALESVGEALERLARAAVREQADAGLPVDERLTPRLFIRIPGPMSIEAGEEPSSPGGSEVVGSLVLEDPQAARNPISTVRMGARLLQVVITSDGGRARLQQDLEDDTAHTFRLAQGGVEGSMDITVTANADEVALSGFDAVVSFLESELRARQSAANVPHRDQYIIEVVDRPLEAQALSSGPAVSTLLVLLVGILLALVVPRLLDRRIQRDDATRTACEPFEPVSSGVPGSALATQRAGGRPSVFAAQSSPSRGRPDVDET